MNVLITIPHYSTIIPPNLRKDFKLTQEHMNKHLDFGTEKIFDLPNFPVLKATVSRFVVDLNRERDDLREGQGVIITETWGGEIVLKKTLTKKNIESRLKNYYDPFYLKLDNYIHSIDKPLFVLDGHSMDSKGSLVSRDSGSERPEIDIATGKGTCSEKIMQIFEKEFKKNNFKTERNKPYSGERAKIIHYCNAHQNVQALELEINKKVYMDEKTFEFKIERIEKLRSSLTSILNRIKEL
ncbi:MAG TPA: N-formylglutamate amidohydrolase [archaeon]|nr:N-formylglutamate amidohydrolase [archaeon]